jgi:hypothetical protein
MSSGSIRENDLIKQSTGLKTDETNYYCCHEAVLHIFQVSSLLGHGNPSPPTSLTLYVTMGFTLAIEIGVDILGTSA